MSVPNLSKEEEFAYYISSGKKSKTEAYQLLFDCNGLSNEAIRMRAWRYSNSPQVLHLLANEADNLYVKYNKARTQAFEVLLDLTLNASSEKVQSDSAIGLLNQTAKLAKNIEINVLNNEFTEQLNALRQTLLTPHSLLSEGNNTASNSNSNSQKFDYDVMPIQDDNVSKLEAFRACGVKYILNNKPLTLQVLNDQQYDSINPLSSRDGDLNARITDTDTGKFVSYEVARYYLEQQDSSA